MKKSEFIGYLYALKDLAVDDTFDDFDDGVEWVLDKIIERAQQLEEPVTTTIPYTPPYSPTVPWPPYGPWITYTSNNSGLDNPSEFEYNGIKIKKDPLVGPNDWEVKCDTTPNFTVVK